MILLAVDETQCHVCGPGGIVTDVDPVQQLRMAAIEERLGYTVGSDRLINAALDAVLASSDSPTLPELAGLARREEPEAHDLFSRVIDELALAPTLPADPIAARWELVRWWCQLIADEQLSAEVGGQLIWQYGYSELNYPDALQPLIGWVSEWEDWTEAWTLPRKIYRERIIDAAKELLAQTWPPQNS